jgi:hypothetical protein
MPAWTMHDLRRTARSLLARAGVGDQVAERVLGHAIAGVQDVYNRHNYVEEKADALARLAALIEEIVTTGPQQRRPRPGPKGGYPLNKGVHPVQFRGLGYRRAAAGRLVTAGTTVQNSKNLREQGVSEVRGATAGTIVQNSKSQTA